jgi:GT2 family glycosyltransferase
VIKACNNIEAEIIVIDNNSTDGSKEFFANKFPTVKFIWNKENVGFAKANNLALPYCNGEYILFLNPDTILPGHCLKESISFISKQPNPGALGVRLIDGAGNFLRESKRAFPSPLTSLFKLSGLARLFPQSKIFARYYLGNLSEHESYPVDVLVGAFMLIPKKVLDTTGSFDEAFFMYGEDIDLSYRIQKAGFINYYFSDTTVIHFKGESTKKGSLNYIKVFYKAMNIFVKKHYSGGSAKLFMLLMQIAIWITALFSGISSFFKKLLPYSTKEAVAQKILIASTHEEYNAMLLLLQKSGLTNKFIGRLPAEDLKNIEGTKKISQLSLSLTHADTTEIIFCEGELSFEDIITIIQELPETIGYKFYAAGSSAVIGSNDKDSAGDFILLDRL